MLKVFPVDFVRQILEQQLYINHLSNVNLFGGTNQVNLISFYEQLKSEEEVDRFVETYRELTDQQNRSDLIGAGIIVSPENPTITNVHSALVIPFTFTCNIRCKLSNRDQMVETINALIASLKGRKRDVAQLICEDSMGHRIYKPFMVGTPCTMVNGSFTPLKNGDYLGEFGTIGLDTQINNYITALNTKLGTNVDLAKGSWVYFTDSTFLGRPKKLCVALKSSSGWTKIEDDGTYEDIIFPEDNYGFEKYKVSLSFDSLRVDEPRTLDADDVCDISFGGSATLVNENVLLGNDLTTLRVNKSYIVSTPTNIEFSSSTIYDLEPLEMSSGNNANTITKNLVSNNFLTNSHTDAIATTIQYSFILDLGNTLLSQWFYYARYGKVGITQNDISPNMVYTNTEIISYWGNVIATNYLAKIVENIDLENTESDVLSLTATFQIQGANN